MNDNLSSIRIFQTSADYADYTARWHDRHGDETTAGQFYRRRDRLITEVDILWNHCFEEWSVQAKKLTLQAKTVNKDLEKQMKKIGNTAENTRASIQVLALLDQVLDLAKEIIP